MDELLKQLDIRGISWRSLLLAGAFPALLLVVTIITFERGWQGCHDLFMDIADFKHKWVEIIKTLTEFVVLIGIFVTVRAPIFAFYRRLPVPILHRWSLHKYARKRSAANLRKAKALWNLDVAKWHEVNFTTDVFVAEIVRVDIRLPELDKIKTAAAEQRAQIVEEKRFRLWRASQLHKTIGHLYILTAMRNSIEKRAFEISQRDPQQAATANWMQAEKELGYLATDGWIDKELDDWRSLCQTNTRAQSMIRSLDRDELYDNYSITFRIAGQFPRAEWIEATSLGNTMAALEDYSTERYQLDTNTLWSRVEKVIPREQRDEVYSSQISVYSLLNASAALTMAFLYCLAEFTYGKAKIDDRKLQHIGTLVVAYVMAWIFLRFAVYASGQLRYQIESRIDLYVPRWLAALGLVPKDINERREMIVRMGQFVNGSGLSIPNFSLHPITDPSLFAEKQSK